MSAQTRQTHDSFQDLPDLYTEFPMAETGGIAVNDPSHIKVAAGKGYINEGAFRELAPDTKALLARTVKARPGGLSWLKFGTAVALGAGGFITGNTLLACCLIYYALEQGREIWKGQSVAKDSARLGQVLAEQDQVISRLTAQQHNAGQSDLERAASQEDYMARLQQNSSSQDSLSGGSAAVSNVSSANPVPELLANLDSPLLASGALDQGDSSPTQNEEDLNDVLDYEVEDDAGREESRKQDQRLNDQIDELYGQLKALEEEKSQVVSEADALRADVKQANAKAKKMVQEYERDAVRWRSFVDGVKPGSLPVNGEVDPGKLTRELESVQEGNEKWQHFCRHYGDQPSVLVEDMINGLAHQKADAEKWGAIADMLSRPGVNVTEEQFLALANRVLGGKSGFPPHASID